MGKLEIGGGAKSGLPERINLDMLDGADIVHNLESGILPFEDSCFDDVYSSHCIEHVSKVHEVIGEVLRVSRIGARVEIRVPHWLHSMASCPGHCHVISDRQLKIWCDQPQFHPFPAGKRFKMLSMHYQPDVAFFAFKQAFPNLNENFILENMPNCCHEIRCVMEVVSNG